MRARSSYLLTLGGHHIHLEDVVMTQHQHTHTPAPRSAYGTEANPNLQRHHWQALACMVATHRPEWSPAKIIDTLWLSRNKQTFPQLASTALTVALDPKYKSPGAIRFAASGVISL